MIKILVLIFSVASFAANEPIFIKGQQGATKEKIRDFQAPNNLATKLGTEQFLVETGNTNILSNPSFEHQTFSTGWTNSVGTFTQETSVLIDGKASAKLVLSAQTMSLTQSSTLYAAQFADGVQGLAMVRIKSNIALKVCSTNNGTVSTTNCVTTNTDSKWGLYKIPFILGATSNGISIASTGAVSGTVYIDDAFVGAVDLKADIPQIQTQTTNFAATSIGAGVTLTGTPTTIGSGNYTVSSGVFTALRDVNIFISCRTTNSLNAGTQPTIMANGVSQNFSIPTPTVNYASIAQWSGIVPAGNTFYCKNDASTASSGTVSVLTTNTLNTSVYTSSCGANCVDTFSAKINTSGDAVTDENVNFINGSCTDGDPGESACTWNTGIFTVAPNCVCSISNQVSVGDCKVATTSSGASIYTSLSTNYDVQLACQKQGADFVATRNIVGSFNEVMVATGVSKPKVCYYDFGGASSTLAAPTVFTTGTAVEIYDSCNAVTPPSWSATGDARGIVFANGTWANSTPVKCTCVSSAGSSAASNECMANYFITGSDKISSTSSGGFTTNTLSYSSAGSSINSYVSMTCEGSAP